tara:strand:+ start:606 stop:914 length:309 start_codon:yes stop_codon:yes gene_type:complete
MATVGFGLSFLFGDRNLFINVDFPQLLLPTNNRNVSLLSVFVGRLVEVVPSSFVVSVGVDDWFTSCDQMSSTTPVLLEVDLFGCVRFVVEEEDIVEVVGSSV